MKKSAKSSMIPETPVKAPRQVEDKATLLPCPALEIPAITETVEQIDRFLARAKPYAAALAVETLADVAKDRHPPHSQINAVRVSAALGLAKISGALIERVQVQQHTTTRMVDMTDAQLIKMTEDLLAAEARQAVQVTVGKW